MFLSLKSRFSQHRHILTIFTLISLFTSPPLYATDQENSYKNKNDRIESPIVFYSDEKAEEKCYAVNMQYKYDEKDMNALLPLRALEAGLDLDKTILMPPLPNIENRIEEHLREEKAHYRKMVLKGEIEPIVRTILIPINLNKIHWVGLIIRLDEDSKALRIQYIDSLGSSIFNDAIPNEIQKSLKKVYGAAVRIENLMFLRQTDGMADGALTVENLIRAIQKNIAIEIIYEESTNLIRNHHINLLERSRPDLHFNIKQRNSINAYSMNKNAPAFQQSLPGRVISLLGTSTAGKTSIVEYIKNKARLKNKDLTITSTDSMTTLHRLYAYLLHSPDKLNLLHRFFTNEEILVGIDNPSSAFDLTNKATITEKERIDIQLIFDELRANKKEIMQRFYSYSEFPYFCSLSFLPALISGKTVIVDTVVANPISHVNFFQAMTKQVLHHRMDVIIIYCPPKQLMERLYNRNAEALRSGYLSNSRAGTFPLAQYVELYEPTIFANQSIDSIGLTDTKIPANLITICRLFVESIGQLSLYNENQWAEVTNLMQSHFGIHADKDKVFIKPKYNYQFLVNTGKEDIATCSEKILTELRILE